MDRRGRRPPAHEQAARATIRQSTTNQPADLNVCLKQKFEGDGRFCVIGTPFAGDIEYKRFRRVCWNLFGWWCL
jgi:hypothetical protein